MKEKFTKGNWSFDREDFQICAGSKVICDVQYETQNSMSKTNWLEIQTNEQEANSYLIAQAPAMYEMLKSVRSELYTLIDEVNDQRMSRVNNMTETPPDLWDMETLHLIDCLLAKARGES